MVIGTQYEPRNATPEYYRHLKQVGVDHICSNPPGKASTWTADHLSAHREKMESFGLTLGLIPLAHIGLAPNDEFPAIMVILLARFIRPRRARKRDHSRARPICV